MKPVAFDPAAVKELDDAVRWYEERSPGQGRRLALLAFEAALAIGDNPAAHARLAIRGTAVVVRRKVLLAFPYVLIFVELKESVVVVSVAHDRRRPRYWLSRLK